MAKKKENKRPITYNIDYDLYVIDRANEETTMGQFRDAVHDALTEIDKQIRWIHGEAGGSPYMWLRNKKTGGLIPLVFPISLNTGEQIYSYTSIKDFLAEWEDVNE